MAGQKIPSSAQWSDSVGAAISLTRIVVLYDAAGDFHYFSFTGTADAVLEEVDGVTVVAASSAAPQRAIYMGSISAIRIFD